VAAAEGAGVIRKLARIVPEALERYFADRSPQHSAAIAYRVLFSIAPLAIVLVSIFGLVLQNDSVRHDVVDTIVDALPVSVAGRKDVENAITAIATPASAAGLISLVVFAWAATGMMAAIRAGLETAMGVTASRPMARGKFVDLLLIVGAAALVIATAGLTALGEFVQHAAEPFSNATGLGASTLAGGFLRLVWFLGSIGVILLIYRFVPARGLRFRDGLVGAVVTALLLQLISFASGLIYDRTTNLSVVYGSLTAALVFLYSIYLYACALLLGAEIAAAWSRPPGPPGPPLRAQLKQGLVGLFVSPKEPPPPPPPPPG
jgi:membrane protein